MKLTLDYQPILQPIHLNEMPLLRTISTQIIKLIKINLTQNSFTSTEHYENKQTK